MKELKNKLKGLRDVMYFDNRFEIVFIGYCSPAQELLPIV